MRLTLSEDQFVQNCLRQLLDEHIQRPYAILREAGAVAELRGLMQASACFGFAKPSFKRFPGRQLNCPVDRISVNTDVHRVQMEIQIDLSGAGPCKGSTVDSSAFASSKVLDLAVLSETPTLFCARSGAGDVVQQVDVASLSAAIEFKASPSLSSEQRGHYVKDLWALLELAQAGVTAYFVLLDKTSSLYGSAVHPVQSRPQMSWEDATAQEIVVRRGPKGDFPFDSLANAGIKITDQQPETPHVQVWRIAFDHQKQAFAPERLYASCAS